MSTTEKTTVSFILNDLPQTLAVNPLRRFSDVLREDLGLTGTKVGCDAGDCGACTILVDGEQRYACLTAVGQLEGHNARTVEGLAKNGDLTALQQAFLDEGAAQCGICTPGMLMAAQSLLDRTPNPTEPQVLDALGGVLCRCTGYTKIVEAVLKAGQTSSSEPTPSSGSAVTHSAGFCVAVQVIQKLLKLYSKQDKLLLQNQLRHQDPLLVHAW